MSTAELALKYAGATGTLMGAMEFAISYDSMTADEIRADLKKTLDKVREELGKIHD